MITTKDIWEIQQHTDSVLVKPIFCINTKRIIEEHIAIIIRASCSSDKRKSYLMLMDYLNEQVETLQQEK
jgi:hypothetical protein